jgi:U3 small nucleolar RNA-associated protein 24
VHPAKYTMGVQKRTRKFATVKRIIGQRDARLKKNIVKNEEKNKKKKGEQSNELIREVYATPSKILGQYIHLDH